MSKKAKTGDEQPGSQRSLESFYSQHPAPAAPQDHAMGGGAAMEVVENLPLQKRPDSSSPARPTKHVAPATVLSPNKRVKPEGGAHASSSSSSSSTAAAAPAGPPRKMDPDNAMLMQRVEEEMIVAKGAAAHITPDVLYDPIKRATDTKSYWIRNQGEHGYINGEILNAHPNNEDFAGARIMKDSVLFKECIKIGSKIAPFVKRWDRGFINIRRPMDVSTKVKYGLHPAHADTRKSSIILSFRFNYTGSGPAGSIAYIKGAHRTEIKMCHGDVGVYMGTLHHIDTAKGILHERPANSSTIDTHVTVMLEARDDLPPHFMATLKSRLPSLRSAELPPGLMIPQRPLLPAMIIPKKQIEQGSFQRFTEAERSLGGTATQAAMEKLVQAIPGAAEDKVDGMTLLLASSSSGKSVPQTAEGLQAAKDKAQKKRSDGGKIGGPIGGASKVDTTRTSGDYAKLENLYAQVEYVLKADPSQAIKAILKYIPADQKSFKPEELLKKNVNDIAKSYFSAVAGMYAASAKVGQTPPKLSAVMPGKPNSILKEVRMIQWLTERPKKK